jgi:ribosomal protein L32
VAGDYLFSQNQRRTNQSPWAPYQQPNQPPANAVDPPFSAGRTLLPDRYISRWRRNNRRVAHSSRGDAAAVVVADEGLFSARTLLPAAAPNGRRAPARAYDLTATSVELYGGAPQEVGKLLPDRARQAPRAGAAAYRQRPFFDPTAIAEQLELFGGRQLFPDRYLSPWRRANRRDRRSAHSSQGSPPPVIPQQEELFGGRTQLSQPTERAWRGWTLVTESPGSTDAVQEEEAFRARQLLPQRYTSRWRRNRRRTAVSSRDSAPPLPLEETYPGRSQFSQPPLWSRRVSILVTNDEGLFTTVVPVQEDESLAGRALLSQPPIWSRKYGVLLVIASGIDFESNVEFSISKTLLPEKAPARLRAARDAYQIAPSLATGVGMLAP